MNADSRREKKGGARTVEAVGDMHKIKRGRNILAQKHREGGNNNNNHNNNKKNPRRTQAIKQRQTGRHLDKKEKRERNPSQ